RRVMVPTPRGRQSLRRCLDQLCEIILGRRGAAQVFNGILAFRDRLLSSRDRTIESLQCFVRPLLEHVAGGLNLEHQSMQTLKQTIVQFPRDTCALADPLFQPKFDDASRYGPANEGSDENRGDGRYRHDEENAALHASHFRDGLRKLAVGLLLNAADQY